MLDIKFIRQNPKIVKEGAQKKGVKVDIDRLLEVDEKKKQVLQTLEDMRAKKNIASKEIGKTKENAERKKIIMEMKELDSGNDRLNKDMSDLDREFKQLMVKIPNLPLESVPEGRDEKDNVVLERKGNKPDFKFKAKNYMEIGESLDLIDVRRAAKISGSRFGFLKGKLVFMEFALVRLALDTLFKKGFLPIVPPVMIKAEMAEGMGYLEQTDDEEAYFLPKDNLYLTATSEQTLGSMHSGEVFLKDDLPRRYVGFSTCFRREAGSYGKDTKGILRVHQFDKVEMFSFVKPEESQGEHKFLLDTEKGLMDKLKLPYQVVNISSGDLGMPAAAKYDIETWLPSENRFRETHSTSNCTDFQARRLNIRYKNKEGKLEYVHTLNGTAFAIGRMLIAIIENYQQKDGSILVPKALQKYLDFKVIGR